MDGLRVNYASLSRAADSTNKAAESLDSLIINLNSAVQVLGDDSFGHYYDRFLEAWAEAKPKLETLKETISEYKPKLDAAAERFKDTDESCTF